MSLRRIKTPSLCTDLVKVYFDSDVQEYIVKIKGKPEADYFTNDKSDALSTAQYIRNNELGEFI